MVAEAKEEGVDSDKQAEFASLYVRANEAANALHTRVYEMAKEIEDLTKDTTIRYVGLRVRVEARGAVEQAVQELVA
jgi:hypothetical protein